MQEFAPNEDVALVLVVRKGVGGSMEHLDSDVQQILGMDLDGPTPSLVVQPQVTPAQAASLYKGADAFILPSRAEGMGLAVLEAMSSGLPVIVTRWGGYLDLANDSNSYLIDCSMVEVPDDFVLDHPEYRGLHWAEPDVAHLRRLMRQVFQNRGEALQKGTQARRTITSQLGLSVTAQRIRTLALEASAR
jgi:glycosyltransferase involved in cell wall biosynthesis